MPDRGMQGESTAPLRDSFLVVSQVDACRCDAEAHGLQRRQVSKASERGCEMNVVLRFKCGHTEQATFDYPRAARDWMRHARTNLCGECTAALAKAQAQRMMPKGV